MKVKCLINKNANINPLVLPLDINKELSDDNFVVSDLEASGSITGYDLSVGRNYIVYGILEYDKETRYLVLDDSNIPTFHSSKLFQTIESDNNIEWDTMIFIVNGKELKITTYSDLLDYNNLVQLINKKTISIRKFLDYKDYIND